MWHLPWQDGVKQTEVDSYVAQQLRQADTDGDGQVTFEDFCEYYQAMSISKSRVELRSNLGMEAESGRLSSDVLVLGNQQHTCYFTGCASAHLCTAS